MKKATKSATTPASPAPVPAKSKKPAAPAAKPVKAVKAAKAAPAPVETPAVVTKPKKAPVKKVVEKKVAPAILSPAPAPVAKAPEAVATTTVVSAQIDVGFGNTLYVRGDGPGLSWEKGLILDCVADDLWSFSIVGAERPVVFKFLLNDLSWSLGEDYIVAPGASVMVTPAF